MKASLVLACGVALVACKHYDTHYTNDVDAASADGPAAVDAGPDATPPDPAALSTETQRLDFGDVAVGGDSLPLTMTVQNTGDLSTTAIDVVVTGEPTAFLIDAATDCDGAALAPGDTCQVAVSFHAATAVAHAGTLTVSAGNAGEVTVDLSGTGLSPGNLEITAGQILNFPTTELAAQSPSQTITVHNNGGSPTASLTVGLSDAADYAVVADGCGGQPLGAGASCDVQVRFEPDVVGSLPCQVSIRESATSGVAASASGTGSARLQVDKTGVGTVVSTPAGISCAGACPTATATFTTPSVQLTATPDDALHVVDAWTGACTGTVGPNCTVALTTSPTVVGVTFRQLECVPSTTVCDDAASHYVECDPTGSITFQMSCPLGCAAGVEKCLDVDPSNGLAAALDAARTGPDVAFTGSSTIDTSTGTVTNNGNTITVPRVGNAFVFKSLSIAGTMRATGDQVLQIAVDGDVVITGTLDASSDGSTFDGGTLGPGGQHNAEQAGSVNTGVTQGAGGGGHYEAGGNGGAAGNGTAGNPGMAAASDADLSPLAGGVGGREDFEINISTCVRHGGSGGGAVQIVSRTSIRLQGSGKVDASGGGATSTFDMTGSGNPCLLGGSGGGAGGSILLEAPTVVLDGAGVVLSTKGGAGSAAGGNCASCKGADGGTAAGAAAGGTNGTLAAGGAGGTESAAPTGGGNGAATTGDGGGGGGSVGQGRINTRDGTFTVANGAVVRSRYTNATVASRLVP